MTGGTEKVAHSSSRMSDYQTVKVQTVECVLGGSKYP